jgi:hypothetical protein
MEWPRIADIPAPRFTSGGVRRNSNRSHKNLDWQGVVDHIAAETTVERANSKSDRLIVNGRRRMDRDG